MRGVRARLFVVLAVVIALVGLLGPNVPVPAATAQAGLFSDAARPPAADTAPSDRTIVRSRYVDVNLGQMDGTARGVSTPLGRGDVLTLNLFDYQSPQSPEVSVIVVRDRVVPSNTGRGYVWSGHVQGSNPSVSPVTIAVENGVMIATVRANGSNYQVRYTPAGVHVIYEVDERQIPPDQHLQMSTRTAAGLAMTRQATRPGGNLPSTPRASSGTTGDTGTNIDMLVAYTTQARVDAGGTDAIVAQINSAVGEANTAYANSQIPQTMRLVGTMETTYVSAGLASGLIPDLQAVTGVGANGLPDPNAPMADVRAMRDAVRADVVSLWVEGALAPGTSGTVGIAWVMANSYLNQMQLFASAAFSVVARRYGTGPAYTFAHEVGHNLGANHDHQTDAALGFTPLYPFAFDFVAPGNAFRTVMAYSTACGGCAAILNFSNPNVQSNGVATGVAGNGANAADNHQVLINTINAVINFRQCNQQPCGATPTAGPSATATATAVGAPPNDNFAAATTLSGLPANFTPDTTNATRETGEPNPSCGNIGRTVWYNFTPGATTQVTVSTVGTSFDTVLGVYTGNTVAGLTQVTCNDDINGAANRQSQVTFTATAGTTYRIQAGSFGSGVGGPLVLAFTGTIPTNTPTRTATSTPSVTPTRTSTPTPTANCTPRPSVTVNAVNGGAGLLQVTISAGGSLATGPRIQQLQIGAATNAQIDIPVAGLTNITANHNVTLPLETRSVSFTVRHAGSGATTVPLTVVDGCGSWPTLVGGGANAF